MISGYPYILIHHCTYMFFSKKTLCHVVSCCVILCHIVSYCVILCHIVSYCVIASLPIKIRSLLPNICGRSILFNKYMFASSHIHNMDYDCGYNGIIYIPLYPEIIFHEYNVMRSPIQLQYNSQLTSTNCYQVIMS